MSTLGRGGSTTGAPTPAYRQRTALPFGSGLDRHTGIMAQPHASQEDLRNVYLHGAKLQLRRGMATASELEAPGGGGVDHLVGIGSLQAHSAGVIVTYSTVTRKVWIFLTDGDGENVSAAGEWFTLHPAAEIVPRIVMAEYAGRTYLAHDEPRQSFRAHTVYVDPSADTIITPLEQDWAEGDNLVRFRGVVAHLDYLVGWGFGTNLDRSPETVRISLPGMDVQFEPQDFKRAGIPGDAVTCCVPVGRELAVFKRHRQYAIRGHSPATFGLFEVDSVYGCEGGRMAVNVGGGGSSLVYFWSAHGPRVTNGGPSQDLAIPLDLKAPTAAELPAPSAVEYAFACFDPDERLLLFVFGKLVYCLSLWDPAQPRWSYWTLGRDVFAGGLIYKSLTIEQQEPPPEEPPPPTPGEAPYPIATAAVPSTTSVQLTWTNVNSLGSETVDIFAKAVLGSWVLARSIAVSTNPQSATISSLTPEKLYYFALRLRRGSTPTEGYEGSDPDEWDATTEAASKISATTTSLPAPTGVWAEEITVGIYQIGWVNADAGASTEVWDDSASEFFDLKTTMSPGLTSAFISYVDFVGTARIRHKRTIGEVIYYSDYATIVLDFGIPPP
jgi:hypothetical protein